MILEMQHERKGSTLYVKIIGLMDYSTIDRFQLDIPDHIAKLVVDFSALDFIDSSGIGAVLSIIYYASERDLSVEFEGLHHTVSELFETVGVFRIMETLQKRGQ
jgi:anti-anti-sigma factor